MLILCMGGLIASGTFQVMAKDDPSQKSSESVPFKTAIFAGGCFWCMEHPFEKLNGVDSVVSGYTGGTKKDPNYDEVTSGRTGHAEAVEVTYDPKKVSYRELLDVFWRNIDPTTRNRQFSDVGSQYRTAIFYHTQAEKKEALVSKEQLAKSGRFKKPIVTEIEPAGDFYVAEEYHQDYYKKNPIRYKLYRSGSGREAYIQRTWGDAAQGPPSDKKD